MRGPACKSLGDRDRGQYLAGLCGRAVCVLPTCVTLAQQPVAGRKLVMLVKGTCRRCSCCYMSQRQRQAGYFQPCSSCTICKLHEISSCPAHQVPDARGVLGQPGVVDAAAAVDAHAQPGVPRARAGIPGRLAPGPHGARLSLYKPSPKPCLHDHVPGRLAPGPHGARPCLRKPSPKSYKACSSFINMPAVAFGLVRGGRILTVHVAQTRHEGLKSC